ncbi:MAG: hypothetical protein Q8N37_02645 [bacterium]|nr:hypothetical protein [bacterium]
MKILEKGKDVEWKREIVCTHCKSKLEINADDIFYSSRYSPIGSNGCQEYSISCPTCNIPKLLLFDSENGVIIIDIPAHIRLRAKNRYLKAKNIEAKNIEAKKESTTGNRLVYFVVLVIFVILFIAFYANGFAI